MKKFVLALLFTLVAGAPAAAQSADEDRAAVRAVIQKLFDGMRTRDTVAMKSVFADGAQLWGVSPQGALSVSPMSAWISSVAGAPPGLLLDEVLNDVEVRTDGNLANVWTYYDFFAGDSFSHCGYDAFILLRSAGEWKIVSVADSRRRDGCRQTRTGG